VPKQVVVVNDFSGGIAKGYSPENLKNNQMQVCDNMVADGIGKLSTVPNTETKSTSDIVTSLPVYNAKNIHMWSTDTTLALPSQASNVMSAPTTSLTQSARKATFAIFFTRLSEFNDPLVRCLDRDRNDEVVFHWQFPLVKNLVNPQRALGQTLQGIDSNIHSDENLSNPGYMSHTPYKWLTHAEMETHFPDMNGIAVGAVESPSNDNVFGWASVSDNYHNGASKVSAVNMAGTTYAVNWVDSGTTSHGLRAMIEFDYWGKKNLTIDNPNGLNFKCPGGRFTFGQSNQTNGNATAVFEPIVFCEPATAENPWANGPNSAVNGASTEGASEDNVFWTQGGASSGYDGVGWDSQFLFGAFSKWEYVLTGVASHESATYGLSMEVWTNANHTTTSTITVTHNAEPLETAEAVITSLISKLEQEAQGSIPDHLFSYTWKDDGTGIDVFQDIDTLKPFGIKAFDSTKSNVVQVSDIPTGQDTSNLVVISGENATANIYSPSTDNWLDYPVDLRIDTTKTYNTPLVFVDMEGYLKVSDQMFFGNSKPQWFGHLDLNNVTYLHQTFDTGSGYYTDDMQPTPFTETTSGGTLNGEFSHYSMGNNDTLGGFTQYRIFKSTNPEHEVFTVEAPELGTNTPHESGLKLWVEFMDGTMSGGTAERHVGSFENYGNSVSSYYYVYIYHGGAISRPQKFKNGTQNQNNGGTNNSHMARADNCSLALALSMGGNLVNGDGSAGMVNARLKGIEIYGYFPKFDERNLLLMMEVDLMRGWRSQNSPDWKAFHSLTNNQNTFNCYVTYPTGANAIAERDIAMFRSHPIISFYDKYKLNWKNPVGFGEGGTGFRTACIFNRRAYYGNVRIKGVDDVVSYFPDGILKSSKGAYDVVSVDNLIEATVNDGDEITCLKVAGNKLMQFKKKSLTIMGVKILENGETREVIEQVINHCGVSGDNQVAETPYGVFWITRSGIYIFNGENLQKLTENLEGSTISKTEWEDFYGERTHVGYDAYWNQAHICKDTQNNPKTLIYAFNTRAFSESNKLYASNHKTGFVNDIEGHLMWAQIGTGSSSVNSNANNSPNFKNKTRAVLPTGAFQDQQAG